MQEGGTAASRHRTAKGSLLALCFALSTGALLASGPVVLDSDSPLPFQAPPPSCGTDFDDDGVCNIVDNCAGIFNPDQLDADRDGRGDLCDNCPAVPNRQQDIDACSHNLPPSSVPSGISSGTLPVHLQRD
jgi:hypothetical protein